MSANDPLDLSVIDPSIWRVLIEEDVYGPYTFGQMRSFVLEGRIKASSKVACGDGAAFTLAGNNDRLSSLFPGQQDEPDVSDAPARQNHVIISQVEYEIRQRVIAVLNELGEFTEIMPGVYLLNTAHRTAKIHECLNAVTCENDRILIVNASDDRLAWIGLRDDIGAHIRNVWKSKT
ncbi:MAG: hypothetical protein Hens3KO_14430 [Henriciella sp.]